MHQWWCEPSQALIFPQRFGKGEQEWGKEFEDGQEKNDTTQFQ